APVHAAAPPPPPASASSEPAPVVASEPPITTIEVTVTVPAPPRPASPATIAAAATTAAAATVSATAAATASVYVPAPIESAPVVFIDKTLTRNTQPDRSEPARVTTKVWDCPWPPRGSKSAITQMKVHVKVTVTADGQATDVEVLDDPGLDFG